MFDVGDEVVCVNDNEPPQGKGPTVVKGQHYTVAKLQMKGRPVGRIDTPFGPAFLIEPCLYVHLVEVPSPNGIGFFAFRFRKVDKKSKETDISVFKEIADGSRIVPLPEDAPVKAPEKVE